AREKQQLAGADRLRVRPNGLRGRFCGDGLFHRRSAQGRSTLRRLDDLARSDAARADAQAPDAAVDNRADHLEVGLEPAGAHVVRVAVLPADDGTLTADFTLFSHKQNVDYT